MPPGGHSRHVMQVSKGGCAPPPPSLPTLHQQHTRGKGGRGRGRGGNLAGSGLAGGAVQLSSAGTQPAEEEAGWPAGHPPHREQREWDNSQLRRTSAWVEGRGPTHRPPAGGGTVSGGVREEPSR